MFAATLHARLAGSSKPDLVPDRTGFIEDFCNSAERAGASPDGVREVKPVSEPRDLAAGPSPLDLAILRLDRALVGLEQRLDGRTRPAEVARNDLFDHDSSQLAAQLQAAQARERELVMAGQEASRALAQAMMDIENALSLNAVMAQDFDDDGED